MNSSVAGIRYARALFDLAQKAEQLDDIDPWLTRLADGIQRSPKARAFMSNPVIPENEKIQFIEKLLAKEAPPLLRDFSKILVEKKRFSILAEVQKIFHVLYERMRGVLEVEMLSAVPFSPKIQEQLQKVLSQKFRAKIHLIPKIEPALIGGFILRFDGKEIDCSLKNRFYEMKQKLFSSIAPLEN